LGHKRTCPPEMQLRVCPRRRTQVGHRLTSGRVGHLQKPCQRREFALAADPTLCPHSRSDLGTASYQFKHELRQEGQAGISLNGDVLCGSQGDWADLKGFNTSAIGTFGGLPFLNQTKIDAVGLFTGQVGYAWNNVLWYLKSGAAFTQDKYSSIANVAAGGVAVGTPFAQASETRWGGVVGTGIEFGFAPGWSVAVEYDHLFMGNGNRDFNFVPVLGGGFVFTYGVKQDVDMGTVRINYTFGGPVVAKY